MAKRDVTEVINVRVASISILCNVLLSTWIAILAEVSTFESVAFRVLFPIVCTSINAGVVFVLFPT